MRIFVRFVFAAAAGLFMAFGRPAAAAPIYRPVVLASYPHNSEHFTQGLFFFQGDMYESTGLYGRSLLARKNARSGGSLWEAALPDRFFGEGACQAEGGIYMLTWREGTAFTLESGEGGPPRLCAAFSYEGEGWGLTFDGRNLLRSDGSDRIFLHELSGEPRGSFQVMDGSRPVRNLNELEYDPKAGLVLANIWYSPLVAAIDARSGKVAFWLDLSELVPPGLEEDAVANGLALDPDGRSLWLTGKLWPIMYQVAWPPSYSSSR